MCFFFLFFRCFFCFLSFFLFLSFDFFLVLELLCFFWSVGSLILFFGVFGFDAAFPVALVWFGCEMRSASPIYVWDGCVAA